MLKSYNIEIIRIFCGQYYGVLYKMIFSVNIPSGEPCETFVGILNSPPARLSREGGTQRRCEGPVPATLLFPLLALLFICGCVLGAFVPPAFEDE